MTIQNNLVGNVNSGFQPVKYNSSSDTAVSRDRKDAPAAPKSEESVNVSLTGASEKLNSSRLNRTLPEDGKRINSEEAEKIVGSASANILEKPSQALDSQANQDPAKVSSLLM